MYQTYDYINAVPQHPEYVTTGGLGQGLPSAGLQDYSDKLRDYQRQLDSEAQSGQATRPIQHPCPACGYCPSCGRGRYQPYQPYYPPLTWTCGLNQGINQYPNQQIAIN